MSPSARLLWDFTHAALGVTSRVSDSFGVLGETSIPRGVGLKIAFPLETPLLGTRAQQVDRFLQAGGSPLLRLCHDP